MSKKDNRFLSNFEPTLTKQSFKDECNINNIVAKYASLGVINHLNPNKPRYIDCVSVPDYQAAFDLIEQATDQFLALPSKIRAHFDNDPEKFLGFVTNPANAEALAKMGLVVEQKVAENSPEKMGLVVEQKVAENSPEMKPQGGEPST